MASPSEAPTPRMVTSGGRSGRAIISIISVERAEVFGLIRRMHGIGLFVLREGSCLRLSRCGRSGCRLCRQRLFAHICSGLYRASKRSPTRGRSPVPESGSLGSVRGARQRASLPRLVRRRMRLYGCRRRRSRAAQQKQQCQGWQRGKGHHPVVVDIGRYLSLLVDYLIQHRGKPCACTGFHARLIIPPP